jgi:hypothetical protein
MAVEGIATIKEHLHLQSCHLSSPVSRRPNTFRSWQMVPLFKVEVSMAFESEVLYTISNKVGSQEYLKL